MDRNQFIGFALIAIMFILYVQFFNEEPQPQEPVTQAETTDSLADAREPVQNPVLGEGTDQEALPDSLVSEQLQGQFGIFSSLASGEVSTVHLENDLLSVDISTLGANFEKVVLKEFTTYGGEELALIERDRSKVSWTVTDNQNRSIDLSQLYFQVSESRGDSLAVLRGETSSGGVIEIAIQLPEGQYNLDYTIRMEGLQNYLGAATTFDWRNRMKHQEHDVEVTRNNSNVNFYTLSEDFEETSERSNELEEEFAEEPVRWFAMKQKFFTSSIISDSVFNRGYISTIVDPTDSTTVKNGRITADFTTAEFFKPEGAGFRYYFGPNDYDILGTVTNGFRNNLYLGWPPVSWVNKWVIIPLFDLLSSFLNNYGLIIIIMVIIIKAILSPLSYKSYLSMAKMRVLKPELDEIKEKHDGDMQKMQQDQMALYRQVGVNPLSGCVPMLLQMPILFAMFYFFPQSIHLRGESFLWAEDLSTYDSILSLPFNIPLYGDHVSLFVLLMTVSTILYTWSNNQISTVQGPMKTVSYVMPVIFLFVLNSFPAALSFYYFVSNLITFGQQAIIKRFVDEEKIREILDENKKRNKNKKKSKFMLKLEEAMKNSEQQRKKKK